MNIPNILTTLRIILIPVIVVVYYVPLPWSYHVSAVIFAVAAVTDWFDGYLARKLNQSTPIWRFFPVMIDCYEEGTDTAFLFFNVNVTFYQMSGGFFTQI